MVLVKLLCLFLLALAATAASGIADTTAAAAILSLIYSGSGILFGPAGLVDRLHLD